MDGWKLSTNKEHVPNLHGHSWSIASGESVALMGESGIGKTTLLKSVVGSATQGRRVGYCPQHGKLLPWKTLIENIMFAMDVPDRLLAVKIASEVGLPEELHHRYASQLSGGQRTRGGLARALASRAEAFVLDEAFAGLDPLMSERCLAFVAEQQGASTLIFATHSIFVASTLADRIIVLKNNTDGSLSSTQIGDVRGNEDPQALKSAIISSI